MTDDAKPAPKAAPQIPQASWVRGGGATTSGKHDRWMTARQVDAESRRNEEAKKFKLARDNPNQAKMRQKKMGGRKEHPCAVLGIKHPKDGTMEDWMICEIVDESPEPAPGEEAAPSDLLLIMQCPRCIRKYHRPPDDTIMHIRQSHRMWHLDQRTKSERKPNPLLNYCAGDVFIAPDESKEAVVVAGMITTDDWCKCPLCAWTFKISDSVVYTK